MIRCVLLAWIGAQLSAPWWYWALLIAYAWYRLIAANRKSLAERR